MSVDVARLIKRLPAASAGTANLLSILRNEKSSAGEIEKCLIACPLIAAKVLQMANSSFYGFSRQINSLREACVILGKQTLTNLVYSLVVVEQFKPGEALDNGLAPWNDIWAHSLFAASLSRALQQQQKRDPTTIFMTGLFQNIGLVLLGQFEPDSMRAAVAHAITQRQSLRVATAQCLGTSYIGVTRQILEVWRFPPDICAMMGALDKAQPGSRQIAILRIAAVCATALGYRLAPEVYPDAITEQELTLGLPAPQTLGENLETAHSIFASLKEIMLGKP